MIKPKLDNKPDKKSENGQLETTQKTLADLSLEQLKCMSYDELVIIEQLSKQIQVHQRKVQAFSQEIASRAKPAQP